MAEGGNIPPEVWAALDAALGLPPGTSEADFNANLAIFDWLFGSSHAGSCGAFREQYFGVKNALDPIMDKSDKLWGQAGVSEHPTPTEIMAGFSDTINAVINDADAQFDQFKGSNLLGQTMFASRLHFYLFRRYGAAQWFGIAQWAQERYLFHQYLFGVDEAAISTIQTQTQDLVNRAFTWDADHQFVVAIQGEVAKLQSSVDHINNVDIPALRATDQSLADAINLLVDPAIARAQALATLDKNILDQQVLPELRVHTHQITKIQSKITDRINPRLQKALRNIIELNSNVIPQIDEQIVSLQGLVPQILEIPQIQQSLITLGQQISQQEQQKTQTILPTLQQLSQGLAELANQVQNEIVPHQELHDQQITNIVNYITLTINVTLQQLQIQTNDIYTILNTVVYPQISIFQAFILDIDNRIKNVLATNCQIVWDCVTRHRKNNPQDSCEEGRTWWGVWTECWMNANTDTSTDIGDGLTYITDMPSILAAVQGAMQSQSVGPWAVAVAAGREAVAAGLANAIPDVLLPEADALPLYPFIFAPEP
jgi:hypothetical protein